MKALGYKATGIHSDRKKPEDVEKVRNAVVGSIDKGYPVLAIDLREVPDWGVIVGYADGGKEFLCRTYYDKTEEYAKAEKWPWVVEVIKEETDKPSPKKSVLESLRIAVEVANTKKYEDYSSGFAAYEDWAGDLLDDSMFESIEKEKLSSMTHANAWSYCSLIDAREAAVRYLRSIASYFGEGSAPRLAKATEIYEEIVVKLKNGLEYAPFPWQLKDGKKWTAEMRHAEAGVLKEVLALEREAIKELETTLSLAAEESYPEVLLEKDVSEFNDLIGRFGHHAVAVRDEVYTQPCVYLSLHLVQMRAAGWEDADFDLLAAVSGASALFAYENGSFMPKYANLSIGMDDRIAEATGFGYEWIGFKGIDGAWEVIKESVDSGKSVKGWDWENILFAGYQDAAKPEDRKVFAMADGPDTFAKWWTWEEFDEYIKRMGDWKSTRFGRHTERVPTKPANVVAMRVIKDLVEWSANPPEHLLKKYPKATFGLAGIELYAENCADMENFEDFGSCHDMNPQWPVRNSSSVYLKQVAEANILPEELDKHLLKAADECKAAYVYWKQFFNHLSYGGGEGWGKMEEHRLAGAEGIRKALEHEKKAIAGLKTALKWSEETVGQVRPGSLVRFALQNLELPDIPYCGAGVPSAVVQALDHGGTKTDYAEVTAASGWAFSFSYKYDNWHVAALPVEDFTFFPEQLGYSVESVRCEDREALWDFVKRHIDAGRPIVSTHTDGGLVYGYRIKEGERQIWFDGTICLDWIDIESPHPLDSCAVLTRNGKERPQELIIYAALARAVEAASPHEHNGVPQGLAALEAYLADVEDATKDFKDVGEWFCWATFERLEARWCCANWLRRAADVFHGEAQDRILAAADHYERAFQLYEQYRQEIQKPDNRSLERIAVAAPILKKAIGEERAGLEEMQKALAIEPKTVKEKL
jgi:hypothetical protein